jgi:hypothetical protein
MQVFSSCAKMPANTYNWAKRFTTNTIKYLEQNHNTVPEEHMTTDMFHLSQTLPGPFLAHGLSPGL